jgi:glycosyltransferase involved in cell wall biosynthesis
LIPIREINSTLAYHPSDTSGSAVDWPRISLVTPVFNSGRYLDATIRSVLVQNYPNLEYIIVDGGSTDGSMDIVRSYESDLHSWVSEPDRGMYDALNKGFSRSSGEIMGWINASDVLHVNSLFVVGSVFRAFPKVQWITGRPTTLNAEGMPTAVLNLQRWARYPFLAGANRYIQQESTFWRRDLWVKAGNGLDLSWGLTSDFELWVRFFRHAQLYSVDALIGAYRSHPDAQGLLNLEECHRTHDRIVERELATMNDAGAIRTFRAIGERSIRTPAVAKLWTKLVIGSLRKWPGAGAAPVIRYRGDRWILEK